MYMQLAPRDHYNDQSFITLGLDTNAVRVNVKTAIRLKADSNSCCSDRLPKNETPAKIALGTALFALTTIDSAFAIADFLKI
jgi:hypothetical protein